MDVFISSFIIPYMHLGLTKAWLCSDTAKRNYYLITPEGWGGGGRREEEGKAIILIQSLVFSVYQFHI